MTEADLPMPLPLLLGVVGLASAVVTALIAAVSKKWRTPADDREDRKIGIEADELLLSRFTKLLEERDKRIDGLVEEIKEVRNIAEAAVEDNRNLIDWIYAAVRVVRDLGGIAQLPPPPKGVTIVDHPSNFAKKE
jgi:acyl-CoA reductase-like NAD-dependent aldehyde dehydrogenase